MLQLILHAWVTLLLILSYDRLGLEGTTAALSAFTIVSLLSLSNEIVASGFLWIAQTFIRRFTPYTSVRLRLTHRPKNASKCESVG